MVIGPGADRRAPRGRPGRRLHRPRRGCRRGHLGEDGLRRAHGPRPAHAADPARRRDGRRRARSSRSRRWASPTSRGCRASSSPWRTSRGCRWSAAALGPVAGLGAARVVASHFSVIVRDTAQLFVAGPPVVAAAMGEAPDKEALGGARTQTQGRRGRQRGRRRGRRARPDQALPLLPPGQRVGGAAARERRPTRRTAARRRCSSIVPRDRRQPYKARRILEAVLDRDSVFELGAALRPQPRHRAGPARRPARWACSPPTRRSRAAG